jgi:uncharacterized protein YbjT (DUF2867 family)
MIVVTGATGMVGSEVVRQLSEEGLRVRALVRHPADGTTLDGPGVDVMLGDLASPGSLDLPFLGAERLFLASDPDFDEVELEANVIGAARRAGVRQVVLLSALGAGPESPVRRLRMHAATEEELRRSGLRWTILQPNFFMQAILESAQTIIDESVIYAPAGGGKASLVDARDVAAVAAGVLTSEGHNEKTLVVTGPEALSYAEAAQKLAAVLGRPVTYVAEAAETARSRMLDAGVEEWMVADAVILLSVIYAQGYVSPVTPTISDVTGDAPRTFETFAMDYVDAFVGAGRAG